MKQYSSVNISFEMARCYSLLLVACVLAANVSCKTFTRCELARELRRQGFPTNLLSNWVCLIEAESGRRTHLIGPVKSDGSRDYGLYQINDRQWCSTTNEPGKDCNVRCDELLTDSITKASTCAKRIYNRRGFNAWNGWTTRCRNKPLPNLSTCGV